MIGTCPECLDYVVNPFDVVYCVHQIVEIGALVAGQFGLAELYQSLLLLGENRIKAFVKMGKLLWTRPINHDIFSLSFIGIFLGFVFGVT